jgi:oligoribonuclease NrnB/cAMP/cGMP phosphodiesterase (DHH superfamily)
MNITQNLINNILSTKRLYFHTGCPDGIIARNFMHHMLSDGLNHFDRAEYYPFSPGNKLEVTENCLFVDCAPIEEQYEDFLQANAVILDHHITNKPKNFECLSLRYPDQTIFGENSNNESGTMLAFLVTDTYMKSRGFISWNSAQMKHVASMIAMGDCWDSSNPLFERARYVGQYVAMHGNEYADLPGQIFLNAADEYGKLRKKQIERHAERVIFRPYKKLKIAFMNSHDGMSDVSEILRNTENVDIIVGWVIQKIKVDGVLKEVTSFSLRSNNSFDCSKFAKYCNSRGGGHPKAAGFMIENTIVGSHYFISKLCDYDDITQGVYV